MTYPRLLKNLRALPLLLLLIACTATTTVPATPQESTPEGSVSHPATEPGGTGEPGQAPDEVVRHLASLKGTDFEIAFLEVMIPHHQGDIDMALVAQERARSEELRIAAQTIIRTQQAAIDQMTGWLATWHDQPHPGIDHGMVVEQEIEHLRTVPPEQFDVAFLEAMILHHEGAIQMAELVEGRTDRPELNNLAHTMLDTQGLQQEQFEAWLQEWRETGGE